MAATDQINITLAAMPRRAMHAIPLIRLRHHMPPGCKPQGVRTTSQITHQSALP
jgi:hypothetical protein